MTDESPRVEQDLAKWEAALNWECDDPTCREKPTLILHLHADERMRHGAALSCESCAQKATDHAQGKIDEYGSIMCPLCTYQFFNINAWQKRENI